MSEPREVVFEHGEHTMPSSANVAVTFLVLVGLALLAIIVGFSDMGPWKVLANLAVAAVQVAVLSYFFMDLRQSDSLTWLCVASAVFWTGLMFLFTLTDYFTRHLASA